MSNKVELSLYLTEKLLLGFKSNDLYEYVSTTYKYKDGKYKFKNLCKTFRRNLKNDGFDIVINNNSNKNLTSFIDIITNNKSLKLVTLCDILNCKLKSLKSIIEIYRKCGYELITDNDMIHLSTFKVENNSADINPLADDEIIFGIASDLHFGSKACQLTALHEFANICKKNGVKYILTPGDVMAGMNVYRGQIHDVYAYSSKEQEDSVLLNLPFGFEWYLLGGNHDYSFISKGGGHNPLLVLETKRDDIHYVGYDDVNLPILNGISAKLWHPCGGSAYSISYRLQKGIEQLAFAELTAISKTNDQPQVRFVFAGHLHIQMQAMFGPIMGMQCGSFEGRTNYLKKLGLYPIIGGYIVKVSINKTTKLIKNFEAKFHIFEEIPDDYKNYKHIISDENEITKPIFEK